MITSMLIVITGALVMGNLQARWVTARLLDSAVENAAIYMEGIVAPIVRDEPSDAGLSEERRELLDRTIRRTGLVAKVLRVNIWRPDGRVIYGSNGSTAHHPPVMESLDGHLSYDVEPGAEALGRSPAPEKVLEIYIPIRNESGELIAIGEFYQDLDPFHDQVLDIVLGSWMLRLGVYGVLFGALLLLVHQAARTISLQTRALRESRRRHLALVRQNRRLARQSEQAKRHALENGERLLSRVGTDIHDGPTQLLALAILNLGQIANSLGDRGGSILTQTRRLISQSVVELRQMSSGLILPEIDGLSPQDAVRAAVERHERQTGVRAALVFEGSPIECGVDLRICIYRIVQEGLNNARQHAPLSNEAVVIINDGRQIKVQIADDGLKPLTPASGPDTGLGLMGLRNRAAAFGGSIILKKANDGTTLLEAILPLAADR